MTSKQVSEGAIIVPLVRSALRHGKGNTSHLPAGGDPGSLPGVQSTNREPPRNTHVVMWIIWFGILNSLVVMTFVVGKGLPMGENPPNAAFPPMAIVPLVLIAVSTFLRWILIPRETVPAKQLVLLILGTAMSEGAGMISLMVIKDQAATQRLLLIASVLAVIQMAPIYAKKPSAADPFLR